MKRSILALIAALLICPCLAQAQTQMQPVPSFAPVCKVIPADKVLLGKSLEELALTEITYAKTVLLPKCIKGSFIANMDIKRRASNYSTYSYMPAVFSSQVAITCCQVCIPSRTQICPLS